MVLVEPKCQRANEDKAWGGLRRFEKDRRHEPGDGLTAGRAIRPKVLNKE